MEKFQVFLLAAGSGQSLYPLTQDYPKHLLPIGNKPILAYVLEYLERHQIRDITIVTSQQNEGELNDYTANTYSKLNPGTVIKYYTPPQGFLGVVDLIPQLYEENVLTGDFILFGGDLITDINLFNIIDSHFKNRADLSFVLLKSEEDKKKAAVFGNGKKEEYMIYTLEENTNRMVSATLSYDMFDQGIDMKSCNLVKHPRVYFEAKTDEANILIFNFSIVKILEKWQKEQQKFGMVTQDLIPFLTDNQYNHQVIEVLKGGEFDDIEHYFDQNVDRSGDDFGYRPFAFLTSDFTIRVNSHAEYYAANLMAVSKQKEALECYKSTANTPVSIEIIPEEGKEEPAKEAGQDNAGKKKKKKKKA